MSEKAKILGFPARPPPIDLTTVGGDVMPPADKDNPIYDYPEPLEAPNMDIPYQMLVLKVFALEARIAAFDRWRTVADGAIFTGDLDDGNKRSA